MPFFSGRCVNTARLIGKTAIVTGCNTGIGKKTVLDFYKRGSRVIMACRNLEKAEEAKKDIEKSCKTLSDTGIILVEKCDLSSLRSVREFCQKILESEPQINILVNNAGVWVQKMRPTDILAQTTWHTTFLTLLLLPRFFLNNVQEESFNKHCSCRSKLANVLFSRELAKKLKSNNIEGENTYSLHPGVIKTELGRHLDETLFWGAKRLLGFVLSPFIKSPEQGAQTTIYCAVDEKCANETGLYYSDCAVVSPAKSALNDEEVEKLWNLSAELVGIGDFNPFTTQDPGVTQK